MSLTGVTFANQKITPSDDGRLYGGILSDGILTGCAVTFAAATLSIAAGSMLIGTRELRTSGETLSLTGATSGYARVIVDIDLTRAATKTSFEQAQLQIQYAASQSAFPALVQQDSNAAGTHYQADFCVVSLGTAGITAIVSKLGISRIASGRLGDGAVQTANLGDGVVTRAKLADAALYGGLTILATANSENPLQLSWGGGVVSCEASGVKIKLNSDMNSFPVNWRCRLMPFTSFTFEWEGISNFINTYTAEKLAASGSLTVPRYKFLDIQKFASTWMLSGPAIEATIRRGTSAPAASLGNVGDLYAQYNA